MKLHRMQDLQILLKGSGNLLQVLLAINHNNCLIRRDHPRWSFFVWILLTILSKIPQVSREAR